MSSVIFSRRWFHSVSHRVDTHRLPGCEFRHISKHFRKFLVSISVPFPVDKFNLLILSSTVCTISFICLFVCIQNISWVYLLVHWFSLQQCLLCSLTHGLGFHCQWSYSYFWEFYLVDFQIYLILFLCDVFQSNKQAPSTPVSCIHARHLWDLQDPGWDGSTSSKAASKSCRRVWLLFWGYFEDQGAV